VAVDGTAGLLQVAAIAKATTGAGLLLAPDFWKQQGPLAGVGG